MLRGRRWVGFTLLAAFFILVFIRLAVWQVSRLHEREAANAVEQAHLSAAPMTYEQLVAMLGKDPASTSSQEWRSVTVTGTWDAAHQVLVRNRTFGGDNGYEIVTPLVPASGAAVLVDRGWVVSGSTPAGPDSVPAAQPGTVTVTGRLQPSDPARPSDGLPPGQVLSMADSTLATGLPYDVLPGHLVLTQEQPLPASAPQIQPDPTLDNGPHLSYAVQWVLFALVAVWGWWTYLRRLASDDGTEGTDPDATPASDANAKETVERH